MKMRSGFVSNSSSSSFVVAIPKVIDATKEIKDLMFFDAGTEVLDMKKLMFGDEEIAYSPYDDNQQNPFDVDTIVGVVEKDMQDQKPNSIAKIAEELSDYDERYGDNNVEDITDGVPEIPELDYDTNMSQEERNKFWSNRQKLSEKRGKILAEKFIKANKGYDVYVFSYADENGELGSMMEHGDIFKNFKHVRISHH